MPTPQDGRGAMRQFCGPYYTYTSKGALTITPYTAADQPLDSAWAVGTIERWRSRKQQPKTLREPNR